ncbi:MAG TPA: M14 family metallopeptidase [Anaerolineae bacterium]|nr:M14 family metallopeptidase [Anaerolineae bacterium]
MPLQKSEKHNHLMTEIDSLFPRSYEESRDRFRQTLARVQELWPNASLQAYPLSETENLTIDWLEAAALEKCEKLLVLTAAEHGIEGYVGSAVLQLLCDEILPQLDARSTGLLLVHAVNPWGMKHHRRTNRSNVDLNRNFITDRSLLGQESASQSAQLDLFLNPSAPVRSLWQANVRFIARLVSLLATMGGDGLRQAILRGQFHNPLGLYYGGETDQPETRLLMDLLRRRLGQYDHMVLLDMHTGYGPRHQMTLVNSCVEPRDSAELEQHCGYSPALKSDGAEFYFMQGDMLDWLYRVADDEFPGKRLYAVSFEFGTLGESLLATARSLRAMVLENQLLFHGSRNSRLRRQIAREFDALYLPADPEWRAKTTSDARRALQGVLGAEEFITNAIPRLSPIPAPTPRSNTL